MMQHDLCEGTSPVFNIGIYLIFLCRVVDWKRYLLCHNIVNPPWGFLYVQKPIDGYKLYNAQLAVNDFLS